MRALIKETGFCLDATHRLGMAYHRQWHRVPLLYSQIVRGLNLREEVE